MSQAVRQRRSLGASRQAHSSGRPLPITSAAQQARLNADDEQERLQREHEARRRRQRRRLDELERANYRDAPTTLSLPGEGAGSSAASLAGLIAATRDAETPEDARASPTAAAESSSTRKRTNAEVKRILTTRKGFNALLDEALERPLFHSRPNYLTAAAKAPRYPASAMCSVCGYWGKVSCSRCGDRYCGLRCGQTHDETRCDRPVR